MYYVLPAIASNSSKQQSSLLEVAKPSNSSNSRARKLSVKHALHLDALMLRRWRYGPKKVARRGAEVKVEATAEDQKLGVEK
jgi:hypothetical protein